MTIYLLSEHPKYMNECLVGFNSCPKLLSLCMLREDWLVVTVSTRVCVLSVGGSEWVGSCYFLTEETRLRTVACRVFSWGQEGKGREVSRVISCWSYVQLQRVKKILKIITIGKWFEKVLNWRENSRMLTEYENSYQRNTQTHTHTSPQPGRGMRDWRCWFILPEGIKL